MPYAALYHYTFLKCPLTLQAPYNDLLSYSKVREFRMVDSVMADKVLHPFSGQFWYLDESWVTISLLDDRLSKEERLLLAKTLVSIPRPESFPPVAASNKLKDNKANREDFWPEFRETTKSVCFDGTKFLADPKKTGTDGNGHVLVGGPSGELE